MKKTFYPLFVGGILSSGFQQANAGNNLQKPNILLILMDDLGYADVGFMPGASPDISTPNIDAIAYDGTIFTSSYVCHPFSGPSRTGLMTGRMPHCLGAQYNLAAFSKKGIDTSEIFISNVMKDAGYYTGIVGKWHLGEETVYHPNNRGFDYFYGFLGGGHEYFSDTWINQTTYNSLSYSEGNYNGEYNRPMMLNSNYVATDKGLYCTDLLTDAAIGFFDNASKDTKPFFLYLSYNAPHTPVQAKASDITAIKAKLGTKAAADGSVRLTYTAMMYNVDVNFKRLIDKLKSTGKFDNTLIVFLSDNGGKTTAGALNSPLKGAKGDTYEGGFRVPMFMHWPAGNVPQGYTNSYNFSSLDFYPTFAYLAGATISPQKKYDGLNVWNDIINKTNPRKDSTIYAMRQQGGFNYTGVVKNNYKLYTSGNGTWYLYDLSTDIGETKNIASQFPDIVAAMKEAVYKWTWTIITPKFFDAPSYGFEASWISTNMPNFGKTFGALYNANDYKLNTGTSIIHFNNNIKSIIAQSGGSTVKIETGSYNFSAVDAALYDIQGRLVQLEMNLSQTDTRVYTFNVDKRLSKGLYFVVAKAGSDCISEPIVVSR